MGTKSTPLLHTNLKPLTCITNIYLTMILCNITIVYIPQTNLQPVKIIVAHFPTKLDTKIDITFKKIVYNSIFLGLIVQI